MTAYVDQLIESQDTTIPDTGIGDDEAEQPEGYRTCNTGHRHYQGDRDKGG